jgi:predicted GIY-YIG superfamily endonuclease
MLRQTTVSQLKFLRKRFKDILAAAPVPFSNLTPSKVPDKAGVYVITARSGGLEQAYYVGRTKNLQQRLYNNHVMGPAANARLKKHLVAAGECSDMVKAKTFLRTTCWVRWILQEGHRERGALEGYVTGLLFPKYGIYEEH